MIFVTVIIPDFGVGEGDVEDVEGVCDDKEVEVAGVVGGFRELDLPDELGGEGVGVVEDVRG